jgi:hypothetical protein
MFDQIGGGGFSIRSGYTQQRHALTRSVPERRRKLTKRAGHWLRHHHHAIAITWWIRRRRRWTNHRRRGTRLQGLTPKQTTINPLARQSNKQAAWAHQPGVAGDGLHLQIAPTGGRRKAHVAEKLIQQLTHQKPLST